MSDVREDEVVEEEVVVAGDEEEVEFVDPSSAEPAPDDEDVEDEFKGLSKKEIIERVRAASAPKGPSWRRASISSPARSSRGRKPPLRPLPPPYVSRRRRKSVSRRSFIPPMTPGNSLRVCSRRNSNHIRTTSLGG